MRKHSFHFAMRSERAKEPIFTTFDQAYDASNVFDGQVSLRCDLLLRVTPPLHAFDVVQQINGPVLAAGEVFHQAHDQAVLGISIDDEGWNLVLSEHLIGFQTALTTDKIVSRTISVVSTGDRNRLLQTEFGDV